MKNTLIAIGYITVSIIEFDVETATRLENSKLAIVEHAMRHRVTRKRRRKISKGCSYKFPYFV